MRKAMPGIGEAEAKIVEISARDRLRLARRDVGDATPGARANRPGDYAVTRDGRLLVVKSVYWLGPPPGVETYEFEELFPKAGGRQSAPAREAKVSHFYQVLGDEKFSDQTAGWRRRSGGIPR